MINGVEGFAEVDENSPSYVTLIDHRLYHISEASDGKVSRQSLPEAKLTRGQDTKFVKLIGQSNFD